MSQRFLHKVQMLTKRILSIPPLRFSHKSQDPHKEGLERAHKDLGSVYFMGGTSCLQRREEESFYTCPPKISRWKPVKTRTSGFENQNIRYLKTSSWSSSAQTGPSGLENRTIWFFLVQWDVECVWPLYFTHLTWIFSLLLSMRLCWQSM
jgi:hypothetical protein